LDFIGISDIPTQDFEKGLNWARYRIPFAHGWMAICYLRFLMHAYKRADYDWSLYYPKTL